MYPSGSGRAEFNWRRELLLLSTAGMEASWLAGWAVIVLEPRQTAGLAVAWFSTLALLLVAITTARTLIRRRTTRSDWIIGGLVVITTVIFINLNLYPHLNLFDPSWPGLFLSNILARSQRWPRELTALFVGFLVWFRGLRVPRRHAGSRTMMQQIQIGLLWVVSLAIVATGFQVNVSGVVATYFAASLLSLSLVRIEEATHATGGAASPFGRKWLLTLASALLAVGFIALIGSSLFTVTVARVLFRPVAIIAVAILSAFALLLGVMVQYLLFPLLVRFLGGRISPELLELQQQELVQQAEGEGIFQLALDPRLTNALRVVGLFLLALIALWLVIRSFRRWRVRRETAGGVSETAWPAGSLADDVLGYLREQWERLRQLADLRRRLQLRGAGSARAIYAGMLTLMAAAGHPRRAGQTPHEYEPTAGRALPARQAEIRAITDAYVRVRYGEKEVSEAELRALRAAWRLVKTDGEKLLENS